MKLIMRMAEEQVCEDEIVDALMVSGIKFEDPLAALKNLIYKHCFIKEINIRIYFREQLMEDALHTEVKKILCDRGRNRNCRVRKETSECILYRRR